MSIVKIVKLTNSVEFPFPAYATAQSAGLDLMAAIEENITLKSGEFKVVPTGVAIALEAGYEAQIRPRSGLSAKYGVTVLNSPGTIDADYRGELKVILINHGKEDFVIEHKMRIAQLVIKKYEEIEWEEVSSFFEETARGDKGFGSTGV